LIFWAEATEADKQRASKGKIRLRGIDLLTPRLLGIDLLTPRLLGIDLPTPRLPGVNPPTPRLRRVKKKIDFIA